VRPKSQRPDDRLTKDLTIPLSPTLHAELGALAQAKTLPTATFARLIIIEHLREREKQTKTPETQP
jgi:hypothetical protein